MWTLYRTRTSLHEKLSGLYINNILILTLRKDLIFSSSLLCSSSYLEDLLVFHTKLYLFAPDVTLDLFGWSTWRNIDFDENLFHSLIPWAPCCFTRDHTTPLLKMHWHTARFTGLSSVRSYKRTSAAITAIATVQKLDIFLIHSGNISQCLLLQRNAVAWRIMWAI